MNRQMIIGIGGIVLILIGIMLFLDSENAENSTETEVAKVQENLTSSSNVEVSPELSGGQSSPLVASPSTQTKTTESTSSAEPLDQLTMEEQEVLRQEEINIEGILAFDYVPAELEEKNPEKIDQYLFDQKVRLLREALTSVLQFQDIDINETDIPLPDYLLQAPLYQKKAFIGRANMSRRVTKLDHARTPAQEMDLYQKRRLEEKPDLYVHDIITEEQYSNAVQYERKIAEEFVENPEDLINQELQNLILQYGDQPELLNQIVLETLGPDVELKRSPYRLMFNGEYGWMTHGNLTEIGACKIGNLANLLKLQENKVYLQDVNALLEFENNNQCLFQISGEPIQMRMIFVNLNIRQPVIQRLDLDDGVILRGSGVGEVDIKLYMKDPKTNAIVELRSNQVLPQGKNVLYQYPADLQSYGFQLLSFIVVSSTEKYYDHTIQPISLSEKYDESHVWNLVGMEVYLEKRLEIEN